jgi:hypothetical protein
MKNSLFRGCVHLFAACSDSRITWRFLWEEVVKFHIAHDWSIRTSSLLYKNIYAYFLLLFYFIKYSSNLKLFQITIIAFKKVHVLLNCC